MLMWGDRLIDAGKIKYGEWEASANGTAGAVDRIAKDIIICDWHYETRDAYESVPMFLEKGFRVWPASWKKPEAAKALIDYSRTQNNPRMLGHLNTTWGVVPIEGPGEVRAGSFGWRPSNHRIRSLARLLEKLQPGESQGVAQRVRSAVLVGRFAPVEADPAAGRGPRFLDELIEFGGGALEREGLFDDDGLADVVGGQAP